MVIKYIEMKSNKKTYEVPYKYVHPQPETVKEKRERKQRFCDLGWEELDVDVWVCSSCSDFMFQVYCHFCGRCEACSSGCEGFAKAIRESRKKQALD